MTTPKAKLAGLALIAVLVLLPCTSTAQQETEEPPAALEQGQGTAVEAPAPQSETPNPSAQQEPPAAQPPPAAPVQSERPAKPSCDARCQAAEQREKSDLKAQQSMADAAVDLVVISWWQFGAGAIGITLLMITLWYTRKSTRAASAAAEAASDVVKVTSETAERQLRAYVHLSKPTITLNEDGTSAINVRVENAGQTPAHHTVWWVRARIDVRALDTELRGDNPDTEDVSGLVLQAGGSADHSVELNAPDIAEKREAIVNSESGIFVYGNIKYRDIFDKEHTTRFQLVYSGPWGGTKRLSTCEKGNEAD